jgi:hypothetical protein
MNQGSRSFSSDDLNALPRSALDSIRGIAHTLSERYPIS